MAELWELDWASHQRHRRSVPAPDGLCAMARDLRLTGNPRAVRRLPGGLTTATHSVRFHHDWLVIKRYSPGDDNGEAEWRRLCFAWDSPLKQLVPEPVALDADGDWFGQPALISRRVPGTPDLRPADLATCVAGCARVAASIHDVGIDGADGPLLRPSMNERWKPAERQVLSPLERRLDAAIAARLPTAELTTPVLTHSDFHPGNLLWSRGRVSGIVDWSAARVGQRWFDISYTRTQLAIAFGRRAADLYLAGYQAEVGVDAVAVAVWDAICAATAVPLVTHTVMGFAELGATVTVRTARRRLAEFAENALRGLDA